MSNHVQAERDADDWTFRFRDPLVTQLRVDYRFSLLLGGGALIAIGPAFDLQRGGATVRVPPGDDVSEVGEALPLFNSSVESVHAGASGELRINFDDAVVATVPVNPDYENWEIVLPDGECWIGTAGGGVAHFPGR